MRLLIKLNTSGVQDENCINDGEQPAGKNPLIYKELKAVSDEKNYAVFNVGMSDENDHHLTYIHLGIMASILLNSGLLTSWSQVVVPDKEP